ncbi:DUF1800 domain-containing protein [Sphingomonas paeninsulae]|nr:DUF1800 domain-containing protein [Sphingomonas paeninsulae]
MRSVTTPFLFAATLLGTAMPVAPASAHRPASESMAWSNRLTWGVSSNWSASDDHGLVNQPSANDTLPPAALQQIARMRISNEPMAALVVEEDAQNRAANAIGDPDQKKAAKQAFQQSMNTLANEAATRSILRDLYASDQLREQLTWFWFNHFNVQAQKRDIRAMVGDYEDQAIRAHALGKFRDLLEATLRHPAMLRYLDNDQNAAGHINENYARELMELHSMGVGSGYSQKDVQELARILTGVGVDLKPESPKLKPQWQPLFIRAGLFEFNPARHDFGDKQFLGHEIKGSGYREVEQALDLIARSPATAHHVSEQLATYFMGDAPPPAVIDRMTSAWRSSDGNIPQVLGVMFRSPEFTASLGHVFKDPIHYVTSAVRMAYGDRVILNSQPIINWMQRMGEGLYAHETPDGYSLASAAWTGPGQMSVRFEIARQVGAGSSGLFKSSEPGAVDQPAFPQLQNALYYAGIADTLRLPTKAVLAQSTSPQEWNALFLSSPDFMRR